MIKKLRLVLIVLFILVGLASAGTYFYFQNKYQTFRSSKNQLILIKKGSSVSLISKTLQKQGVIDNALIFEGVVRFKNLGPQLKAGEYLFEKGLSQDQVIDKLVQGKVYLRKFTIPEGKTLKQVCALLQNKELMTYEYCLEQTKNIKPIERYFEIAAEKYPTNLEGYLYPETYLYNSELKSEEIVPLLVKQFKKSTKDLYELWRSEFIKGYPLTWHQVVTLASVVEKETAAPHERPLIASVFLNRLKIKMPLQTDPTVIYGIPNFDGNLTKAHLRTDHPYNTYTRPGLPAGPICNPGREAIQAVLKPKSSDYLYFVAKKDGTHFFSKNLDQHNKAVMYYQLGRGVAPE